MKCKLIKDFPNYRIYENGVVESNYVSKINNSCDVWRPLKHSYVKSTGYMRVKLYNKGVHKFKKKNT